MAAPVKDEMTQRIKVFCYLNPKISAKK